MKQHECILILYTENCDEFYAKTKSESICNAKSAWQNVIFLKFHILCLDLFVCGKRIVCMCVCDGSWLLDGELSHRFPDSRLCV